MEIIWDIRYNIDEWDTMFHSSDHVNMFWSTSVSSLGTLKICEKNWENLSDENLPAG